jgi:hypothetical protein
MIFTEVKLPEEMWCKNEFDGHVIAMADNAVFVLDQNLNILSKHKVKGHIIQIDGEYVLTSNNKDHIYIYRLKL